MLKKFYFSDFSPNVKCLSYAYIVFFFFIQVVGSYPVYIIIDQQIIYGFGQRFLQTYLRLVWITLEMQLKKKIKF